MLQTFMLLFDMWLLLSIINSFKTQPKHRKSKASVNTSATKAGEQKKQTQKGGNAEKKKAAT
jgi:hypothetical protein